MKQLDLTPLKEAKEKGKFLKIGTVATLNNALNQIYNTMGSKLEEYHLFYRGHADSDFESVPSIYRRKPDSDGLYIDSEDRFCSSILRECPTDFDAKMTAFDMLVKMQHYDLPTRLLDITENPLVALYFASLEPITKGNNGSILIYFIHKDDVVNFNTLEVGLLSSISFLPANLLKKAKTTQKLNQLLNTMRLYSDQLPYIKGVEDLDKTLCVLPRKANPRIMRQQGAFFLFGIQDGDKSRISSLDIEPFELEVLNTGRKEILSQLERYAISEKYLFPEIDHVAHYIKTH